MRTHPKAWTYGIVGATLVVALTLFFTPYLRNTSVAAPKAAPSSLAQTTSPVIETTRIVPAEVLGNGFPWAPLTGDGSN